MPCVLRFGSIRFSPFFPTLTFYAMTQLCLDQLLGNKKSAPVILINDSIQLSALPLLCEFSQRTLEANHHVIVLLTETPPAVWLRSAASSLKKSKVHIIDAYSDPHGWEWDSPLVHETDTGGSNSLVRLTRLTEFERHVLPLVMDWINKAPGSLIVVDSLNPLAQVSTYRTYRFAKALESLATGKKRNKKSEDRKHPYDTNGLFLTYT